MVLDFQNLPRRRGRHEPCDTFHWVGQDFNYCDACSKPYWEHQYRHTFGNEREHGDRMLITPEEAERVRARWER